jgi:hypothetical protein
VAPLEAWEKVLVDGEHFPGTVHGEVGCIECHGGENDPDKFVAHTDMLDNPSDDPYTACGDCHPDVLTHHEVNLHSNLNGLLDCARSPFRARQPCRVGRYVRQSL